MERTQNCATVTVTTLMEFQTFPQQEVRSVNENRQELQQK